MGGYSQYLPVGESENEYRKLAVYATANKEKTGEVGLYNMFLQIKSVYTHIPHNRTLKQVSSSLSRMTRNYN